MNYQFLAPALALALSGCFTAIENRAASQGTSANLVHVIDGDTIIVSIDDVEEHIRIIGIDAPEVGECKAQEATDALTLMLSGADIVLEKSSIGDNRDKYGRLLRYVRHDDADIGALLLRHGYVKNFPWFAHDREEEYEGLESFKEC